MKSLLLLPMAMVVFVALARGGPGGPDAARGRMAAAAGTLLSTLRPELRAKAGLELGDASRGDWHFVPRDRPGVRLREMNDGERAAAYELLRAALSARGYLKADAIMQLDAVLRDLAKARGREDPSRDPEQYTFTVYGSPSVEAAWGWRVEGHHVSLNFSLVPGAAIAVTPAFLGASPAEIKSGPRAGFRALGAEDELGLELLASLDAEQRGRAVLSSQVPADIVAAPGRGPDSLGESLGLPASAMTEAQRAILGRLIDEYVGNLRADLADEQLARIRAGMDGVRFSWIGAAERGKPHYYRVRGPRWVIEYDTTQNDPNHVHTVWRDFDNDFGGDAMKEHYLHDHAKP